MDLLVVDLLSSLPIVADRRNVTKCNKAGSEMLTCTL